MPIIAIMCFTLAYYLITVPSLKTINPCTSEKSHQMDRRTDGLHPFKDPLPVRTGGGSLKHCALQLNNLHVHMNDYFYLYVYFLYIPALYSLNFQEPLSLSSHSSTLPF